MHRILGGIISMDFDVTSYLMIIHSAFVKYLRKMGTQRSSASAILRLQGNLRFSYGRCFV